MGVSLLAATIKEGISENPLELLAQHSSFGWLVSGGQARSEDPNANHYPKRIAMVTINKLYSQIKKLWKIDDITEHVVLSVDEQACEALYASTLVKGENRYKVTLLIKPHQQLGDSLV